MDRRLASGLAVLATTAVVVVAAVASPRTLGKPTHRFSVLFPTASGLVAGSDVLDAGSKVGTVSTIEPSSGDQALVTVQIADDHWPLHRGVQTAIRPKSLLGEKYVDLHDSTSSTPLQEGVTLHADSTSVPVELDQFVNSLDPDVRASLRTLLSSLGAGLAGRGPDLSEAIRAGKDDLQHLAVTGQTLNNRDPDLDRILVGLDGVLSKITTNDQLDQLSQLISNGQQTLNAIEAEAATFSRGFDDAQVALADLNAALDPVIGNLRSTLDVAPHLLGSLQQEEVQLATSAVQTARPDILAALREGLIHGPTTTGGALEIEPDPKDPSKTIKLPIFRICLIVHDSSGCAGNFTPAGVPGSGGASGAAAPPSYTGAGTDLANLAGFFGE